MLTAARARALRQKQRALTRSLETWLEITAGKATRKDPAFEIHYVQTREVDRILQGLQTMTAASVDKAIADGEVQRRAETIETTMLMASQVWEFFRGRLAQRLDPGLATFLRVGDELAWQCYKPIREFALGDSPLAKAPPLVYLNSVWSPFTVVRNREYQAEAVPQGFLRNADFKTALARLPFPIVAVPWYQTVYLPDALSICHEVGHAIEADFGVTDEIRAAIAAAIPDGARAEMWKVRGSELFADYVGCLSVGVAYPWALSNILLAEPSSLTRAREASYPSPYARLLFNARTLHHLGFKAAAKAFTDVWTPLVSAPAVDAAEVDEVLAIAWQFAGGTEPGEPPGLRVRNAAGLAQTLRALIGFTVAQQGEVEAEAAALGRGEASGSSDIRVLFAAASLVWRDAEFPAQETLLKAMRAACVDERRNEEARLPITNADARKKYLVGLGEALAREALGTP